MLMARQLKYFPGWVTGLVSKLWDTTVDRGYNVKLTSCPVKDTVTQSQQDGLGD